MAVILFLKEVLVQFIYNLLYKIGQDFLDTKYIPESQAACLFHKFLC